MSIDLKPCPFCGGKVKKFIGPFKKTVMFVCQKCGADVCFYGAEHEPKATTAWNRRANNDEEGVKREPDDWIKCSEKMPENGKSVLVAIKDNRYSWLDIGYTSWIAIGYIDGDGYWTIGGELWDRKSDPAITHWMLLPKLPEVEQ